jgi:predicted membrane protein
MNEGNRVSDETEQRSVNASRCQRRGISGWVPGAILIVLGTLFLLDHLNIINGDVIWKYWPLLLVAVGVGKVINEGKAVGGFVLILVGIFFMAQHLGYRMFTWDTLWPVIIILAGVAMIWGRFDMGRFDVPRLRPEMGASEKTVQAVAVFGGVERRVHTSNLTGGSLTAMFGGVEMDFRSADIEGEEAVIFLDAMFGGIELVVPDRWAVVWDGQNIFGGYSDETRPPLPDVPGASPRKRLVLRGRAVFGGVSIKN